MAYLDRGKQLWKRAARELNRATNQLMPTEFMDWFEGLLWGLMRSSRRQYISSVREILNHLANHTSSANADLTAAIVRAENLQSYQFNSSSSEHTGTRRTSAKKAKRFDQNIFLGIIRLAQEGKSGKWSRETIIWVTANMFVGLRPCEWRSADWVDSNSKNKLKVVNAKNTNGRSHGKFRHIDLSGLDAKQIKIVDRQLIISKKYSANDEDWRLYYNGVRKTLYRLVRKVNTGLKRSPALYSTRHQFAADAKSAGLELNEIAALMGHAVDDTVMAHYGRKRHGRGSFSVKPNPEEVKRVKLKAKIFKPRSRSSRGL